MVINHMCSAVRFPNQCLRPVLLDIRLRFNPVHSSSLSAIAIMEKSLQRSTKHVLRT